MYATGPVDLVGRNEVGTANVYLCIRITISNIYIQLKMHDLRYEATFCNIC